MAFCGEERERERKRIEEEEEEEEGEDWWSVSVKPNFIKKKKYVRLNIVLI